MSCVRAIVTLLVVAIFCLWAIVQHADNDDDKRRKP